MSIARLSRVLPNLSLGLVLLAGFACDEAAPTETRAATRQGQLGSSDAQSDLAAADVTALSIGLPVNQSVSTAAPAPAFRVNQTGTGPNGNFQISNASNTQNALQGLTNGKGPAGFFRTTNATNSSPALSAQTNGIGNAAQLSITNSASSGPALLVQTNGVGSAGRFVSSGTGPSPGQLPALSVDQQRPGGQGIFVSTQRSNAPALEVDQEGTGMTAMFRNGFQSSTDVLTVWSQGHGASAGAFSTFNHSSTAATVNVSGDHPGRAFTAVQIGGGEAGHFEINNASNGSATLSFKTNGTGPALAVDQGNSVFFGNVTVNGTLTKSAGSFRIDDPLDPEHKYLSHSFVESPDMMNVYNGNAILDEAGKATVDLPNYFEALNKDFRYQLTAIGAPGPNLYIAEGVQHNHFRIAGGRAYAHVSWQVTGIRHDTYAEEHRIKVEEEKPSDDSKPLVATR